MGRTRGLALLVALYPVLALALSPGVVPDRVIVKFKSGTTKAKSDQALASMKAREARQIGNLGIKVLELPPNSDEVDVASKLRDRPEVEFAEPDCIVEPAGDPLMSNQWHINRLMLPQAWMTTQGNPSVIIAILDTGCDPTHPDLASKYVGGWNFYSNNSNWADVHGHGTGVAGLAAAATNNDIGVAGVGFNCRIMPLRVSSDTGSGLTSLMANALVYAADNGARVANISYAVSTSATVQSAAQYFMSKGGVVTIAAGNSGSFVASADNPYVLAVSATTTTDEVASWSTTGNNVDVSAPGASVYSTCRGGGYGAGSGTSYSAPIVAGVAGLVVSANPGLSGGQIYNIVKASADDLGATGWDSGFGAGRVNADRAVAMAVNTGADTQAPTVAIASPSNGSTLTSVCNVTVNANDNVGVANVELSINGTVVGNLTSAPYSWTWNTCNSANGSYVIKATARDGSGNMSTTTSTVSVQNPPDTTPPSVGITSPTQNAFVNKPTSIVASASDNVAVARVEFYVDGQLHGTSTGPAYSVSFNPKRVAKGTHTIQARAYDTNGNATWSTVVTIRT